MNYRKICNNSLFLQIEVITLLASQTLSEADKSGSDATDENNRM